MGQRHSQAGIATEPDAADSPQANETAKLFAEVVPLHAGGHVAAPLLLPAVSYLR